MAESDGLTAFDGFVRKAADAGMFNDEQLGHMRYLSTLTPEQKCGCRWYPKWECYNCNLKLFEERGGTIRSGWDGSRYFLPAGDEVTYAEMRRWLQGGA